MEAAILQSARAYDFADERDFIGDWACIVENPRLDAGASNTSYYVLVTGGQLPPHRLQGLFAVASEITGSGWGHEDDDED